MGNLTLSCNPYVEFLHFRFFFKDRVAFVLMVQCKTNAAQSYNYVIINFKLAKQSDF